jgi:retron-type reverse transcriptase
MIIEKFFNIEYLTELYSNKLSNSKAKGIDKINSFVFKDRLESEIEVINRKVSSGTYKFSPFVENLKLKGRNKAPRIISIPTLRDRIVMLSIKELLHDTFPESVNRKMPNSFIRDIKKYLIEQTGKEYFIKLDIKGFYDNIDRKLLINKLKAKDLDSRVIELISNAITTPSVPLNTNRNHYGDFMTEKGVPQGLSISNILAQIYLSEVDKVIDKRKDFYLRYVDDILMLDKKEISYFRYDSIKKSIEDVNLILNKKKTEKGLLKDGFSFLSYKITDKGISIADKNVELFIRRVAGKFTWFKKGISNKANRAVWLNDDDRFKEVFIEELNETITGIISSNKNYGWLFYFSEMTDEGLLFKIDNIIRGFFSKLVPFEGKPPMELKKLSRTFKVIKHKGSKRYLCNYDNYNSVRRKRNFLIFRGKIDPDIEYSDSEIDILFQKYKKKQISKVEKDIGYNYM